MTNAREEVSAYLDRLGDLLRDLPLDHIEAIAQLLLQARTRNKHIFIIGNGGSAATASHFACDLSKNASSGSTRFSVFGLTDNVPVLSALANDIGYDHVFVEQLTNLMNAGDVLIAFSGSGSSPNILRALRYAQENDALTIAFLGFDGGVAIDFADEYVLIPSNDYGLIEDIHLALAHALTAHLRTHVSAHASSKAHIP